MNPLYPVVKLDNSIEIGPMLIQAFQLSEGEELHLNIGKYQSTIYKKDTLPNRVEAHRVYVKGTGIVLPTLLNQEMEIAPVVDKLDLIFKEDGDPPCMQIRKNFITALFYSWQYYSVAEATRILYHCLENFYAAKKDEEDVLIEFYESVMEPIKKQLDKVGEITW